MTKSKNHNAAVIAKSSATKQSGLLRSARNDMFLLVIIAVFAVFAIAIPSFAEDAPAAAQSAPQAAVEAPAFVRAGAGKPSPVCGKISKVYISEKRKELTDFIKQHFESKDDNTKLLPVAIEKFREHAKELKQKTSELFPLEKARSADELAEMTACEEMIDEELRADSKILRRHVNSTAQAKKTTKLLDALKAINSKLDRLNLDMAQMYGYMETFASKLPCYAPDCT